jgi:hypothetical protein
VELVELAAGQLENALIPQLIDCPLTLLAKGGQISLTCNFGLG